MVEQRVTACEGGSTGSRKLRAAALEGEKEAEASLGREDTVSKTNTATTTTERSQGARKHNVRKLL